MLKKLIWVAIFLARSFLIKAGTSKKMDACRPFLTGIDISKMYDDSIFPAVISDFEDENPKGKYSFVNHPIFEVTKSDWYYSFEGAMYDSEKLQKIFESDPYTALAKEDTNYIANSYHKDIRKMLTCVVACVTMKARAPTEFDLSMDCPNPCKQRHACSNPLIPGGKDTCERVNSKIFSHEYKCICRDVSHEYDPMSKKCFQKGSCNLETSGCVRENTKICLYSYHILKETQIECVCKAGYTGPHCEKKIELLEQVVPCQEPDTLQNQIGAQACNTAYPSNKCRPRELSFQKFMTYQCECDGVFWDKNTSLPYDNCLLKLSDPCLYKTCGYGQCHKKSIQEAMCVCEPGYAGDYCTEWVGSWSPWSDWSKCLPNCGSIRYSLRTRSCQILDGHDRRDCQGQSVEVTKCDPNICRAFENELINDYFSNHNYLAIQILFSLMCAVAFFYIVLPKVALIWLVITNYIFDHSLLELRLADWKERIVKKFNNIANKNLADLRRSTMTHSSSTNVDEYLQMLEADPRLKRRNSEDSF